jgi:hypothetical protein
MTMAISDDNSLWSNADFQSYREGQLYFVVPERRIFAGPIGLAAYLSHSFGDSLEPTLARLEALKSDPALIPAR